VIVRWPERVSEDSGGENARMAQEPGSNQHKLGPGQSFRGFRLGRLSWLRESLTRGKLLIYRHLFGMDVHPTVKISLSASLDKTFPKGVHVGQETYIAFDVRILTHDFTRGLYLDTRIGSHCFIGGRALVLPGVEIGDRVIVGAGSVVTKSVPSNCIVVGNPARVVRNCADIGPYGRLTYADATTHALFS
jgi:acetyltransferase-like isoleucine patch superfamily enzyme